MPDTTFYGATTGTNPAFEANVVDTPGVENVPLTRGQALTCVEGRWIRMTLMDMAVFLRCATQCAFSFWEVRRDDWKMALGVLGDSVVFEWHNAMCHT